MGMTHFMRIISPKGSGTYLFSLLCPRPLRAIPDSGARNPVAVRRPWVRLVVAYFVAPGRRPRRLGDELRPQRHSPQSYFSKCRISRMIGVTRQIVEHSA
jgi:hypothetical protein